MNIYQVEYFLFLQPVFYETFISNKLRFNDTKKKLPINVDTIFILCCLLWLKVVDFWMLFRHNYIASTTVIVDSLDQMVKTDAKT